MFKILTVASIGVVLILLLRTHKENKAIPVFKYNEETSLEGDSSVYMLNDWKVDSLEGVH